MKFLGFLFWFIAIMLIFYGSENAVKGEPSFIIYNGGFLVFSILGIIFLKKAKLW